MKHFALAIAAVAVRFSKAACSHRFELQSWGVDGCCIFKVDIGHPGVDNAFLIDTGDPIASCHSLSFQTPPGYLFPLCDAYSAIAELALMIEATMTFLHLSHPSMF